MVGWKRLLPSVFCRYSAGIAASAPL